MSFSPFLQWDAEDRVLHDRRRVRPGTAHVGVERCVNLGGANMHITDALSRRKIVTEVVDRPLRTSCARVSDSAVRHADPDQNRIRVEATNDDRLDSVGVRPFALGHHWHGTAHVGGSRCGWDRRRLLGRLTGEFDGRKGHRLRAALAAQGPPRLAVSGVSCLRYMIQFSLVNSCRRNPPRDSPLKGTLSLLGVDDSTGRCGKAYPSCKNSFKKPSKCSKTSVSAFKSLVQKTGFFASRRRPGFTA